MKRSLLILISLSSLNICIPVSLSESSASWSWQVLPGFPWAFTNSSSSPALCLRLPGVNLHSSLLSYPVPEILRGTYHYLGSRLCRDTRFSSGIWCWFRGGGSYGSPFGSLLTGALGWGPSWAQDASSQEPSLLSSTWGAGTEPQN